MTFLIHPISKKYSVVYNFLTFNTFFNHFNKYWKSTNFLSTLVSLVLHFHTVMVFLVHQDAEKLQCCPWLWVCENWTADSFPYSADCPAKKASEFPEKESAICHRYTASQKHESTLLHTYVLNEFLTADNSCKTQYFWKNSYRIW